MMLFEFDSEKVLYFQGKTKNNEINFFLESAIVITKQFID